MLRSALALGYSRNDIDKMYKHFRKIDLSDNGVISITEYSVINRISKGFCEMIFNYVLQFKEGHHSHMDFKDYVLNFYEILMLLDTSSMTIFMYELFDADKSG